MSNDYNSKKINNLDSNMLRNLLTRGRLVLRLLNDSRIGFMQKLIPIGSLIYLISPIDFIMGIPGLSALDDVGVILFGFTLFIEMCPPAIVDEHLAELTGRVVSTADGDIVDGEVSDLE